MPTHTTKESKNEVNSTKEKEKLTPSAIPTQIPNQNPLSRTNLPPKMNPMEELPYLHLTIPFSQGLRMQDVIVFDSESQEQDQLLIFGYYRMGDSHLHQIIFPKPIPAPRAKSIPIIRNVLATPALVCYHVAWEQKLFQLPDRALIETMPYPYCPKNKYIQLENLDHINSKKLKSWSTGTISEIAFHNYCCLVKTILLYLGKDSFSQPNVKTQFMEVFATNVSPRIK